MKYILAFIHESAATSYYGGRHIGYTYRRDLAHEFPTQKEAIDFLGDCASDEGWLELDERDQIRIIPV